MKTLRKGFLQFKRQMEDYILGTVYDPEKQLGHWLDRYIEILGIKMEQLAEEINIDAKLLGQILNFQVKPPEEIVTELGWHYKREIPADYWLQIINKERQIMGLEQSPGIS